MMSLLRESGMPFTYETFPVVSGYSLTKPLSKLLGSVLFMLMLQERKQWLERTTRSDHLWPVRRLHTPLCGEAFLGRTNGTKRLYYCEDLLALPLIVNGINWQEGSPERGEQCYFINRVSVTISWFVPMRITCGFSVWPLCSLVDIRPLPGKVANLNLASKHVDNESFE